MVYRAAVAANSSVVEVECRGKESFVARHNVCQVAKRLGRVAVRADVDMNSASSCCIALRAFVAKLAAKFLQGFDVVPSKDRGNQLALFFVGSCDAYVSLFGRLSNARPMLL